MEVKTVLSQLENNAKVVGAKQTRRALRDGKAVRIFLAKDADPALTEPIEALSQELGVEVEWISTMKELGITCGIAVGAAVAAVLS